jgi:CPA1 family monovalent cation:H+ antiporter
MQEELLIKLAVVGVLGSVAQWFSWWVKLPSILFLLLLGFLVGPITGYLNPDEVFGDLLFPMVSLAVSVILFEGALTLNFKEIKGLQSVIRQLVSTGLIACWIIIAIATHYLIHFDWPLSFLFGALVVVTGPTVIVPMLRTVRVNSRISNILRWEGIIIDPIGALLAVMVFNFIVANQGTGHEFTHVLLVFTRLIIVGSLLGIVAGQFLGLILRYHLLPEYLHNIFTLTLVFGLFGLANHLEHESGLLAVTIMGIWLANMKNVAIEEILNFKESLSLLLISGLFIILASRIDIAQIQSLGWASLAIFAVIQFIARPIKVWLSTLGSHLKWQEKAMISWIAPRGIVAAAVSALFAIKLEAINYPQANLLVSLTFIIIITTVVVQSASARSLAKLLGVAEPESIGLLIVGANPVAQAIAKCLQKERVDFIIADSYWQHIKHARMEGFKTYYGNPVSKHADQHLHLVGIGHLLGLSMNRHINTLAAQKYASEFGRQNIYTLKPAADKNKDSEKHLSSIDFRGSILFAGKTYAQLASYLAQGAVVKSTLITEEFTFKNYMQKHSNQVVPLFTVSPQSKQIKIFHQGNEFAVPSQWVVIGLFINHKENDQAPASNSAP